MSKFMLLNQQDRSYLTNYNKNQTWQSVVRIILTLCLSMALCMTMSIPKLPDNQTTDVLTELLWNITESLASNGVLATLLWGILLWVNQKIDVRKTERRILFPLASGFIALIWLMAEGFRVDDTLWTLHASLGQVVKSVIYFVGITYGLNQIAYFLYSVLEEQKSMQLKHTIETSWQSQFTKVYQKHTVFVSFVSIFVLWLPHLILAYPANLCSDSSKQLAQFFGLINYSTHHPIVSTLIMGGLVKLGSLISYNFGLFLYIAAQALLGAWILAYTLHLMRELNAPIWLRILSFGCYIFVPYYTAYIGVFLKDVPYSYMAVLFVIELIYFLLRKENFFRSKRHLFLMGISIAGSILLRNNGKYMIYPTVAAVLLYLFFYNRKTEMDSKKRRRFLGSAVAIFLIPVLLSEMFSFALVNYLDAAKGSNREAFSLFIQQTARYVKEYGDAVTEEERAAISAVMDYENLADNYDPKKSDSVKTTFAYDATTEELKNYFKVWLKQFTKHPFVYFKATINQNYYLLYPMVANTTVYVDSLERSTSRTQGNVVEYLQVTSVEPIAKFQTSLKGFYTMCFYLPVLNMLSHPAFYMILLILLTLFSLYRKRFLWILASIPIWLSAVIVILAPVIQGHPRYAFPIIYAMPVLFSFFLYLRSNNDNNNLYDEVESVSVQD